jgi:hypothetical protein
VYVRAANELRKPSYLWHIPFYKASLGLMEGRFQDCERLAREAGFVTVRRSEVLARLFGG